MARRFQRARNYAGRGYGYARRAAGWKRSYSRGGFSLNLNTTFLVGALVGLSNYDNQIPAPIKLAAATLPVKGKGISQIKQFAQGMVLGDVIQNMTGFTLGGGGAISNTNSGSW